MEKVYGIKKRAELIVHRVRIHLENCMRGEEGFGTVEIVLLLLVLVGLVLIFKDKVSALVDSVFKKITTQAGKI